MSPWESNNKTRNAITLTNLKTLNLLLVLRLGFDWNKPMLTCHCSVFTGIYNGLQVKRLKKYALWYSANAKQTKTKIVSAWALLSESQMVVNISGEGKFHFNPFKKLTSF